MKGFDFEIKPFHSNIEVPHFIEAVILASFMSSRLFISNLNTGLQKKIELYNSIYLFI